jgi:hypothetical protein
MLDGAWRGGKGTEDGRGSPKRPAGWARGEAWWAGPFRSGGLGALGLYEALEFHSPSSLFFDMHCTLNSAIFLSSLPTRY